MLFQVPKFIYTIKEQKILFIPLQGKFHNGLRWQEATDSVEHIEKQVKTKSWKKNYKYGIFWQNEPVFEIHRSTKNQSTNLARSIRLAIPNYHNLSITFRKYIKGIPAKNILEN